MAILERQIKPVRPGKWEEIGEQHKRWHEAESRCEYPPQKRYRAVAGSYDTGTLIIEREWQSFAAMEAAHMKAGADPEIQALRGESQKVFDSVRFQFHMVIA